jgi:hypothetical protein
MRGEDAGGGYADHHDGRLRVLGQAQSFFRPLETQLGKRESERRVGLGKGCSGYWKSLGKLPAHANGLRTLPRKEESNFCGHFFFDFISRGCVSFILIVVQFEKRPSAAEAPAHFRAFAARLKSCPFKAASN